MSIWQREHGFNENYVPTTEMHACFTAVNPSELTARSEGYTLWRRERQGTAVPLPTAGLLPFLVFGLRKERRLT